MSSVYAVGSIKLGNVSDMLMVRKLRDKNIYQLASGEMIGALVLQNQMQVQIQLL